ncbi:MAG: hypothetical protein NXI32_14330 [bacterium]|nr:hypothetical protein [bacterium]
MSRKQLCDFCSQREVLDYRFRLVDGYAAICGRCRRLSIPDPNYKPTAGDFCCVVDPELSTLEQKMAGTGDDDARPQKEFTYEQF